MSVRGLGYGQAADWGGVISGQGAEHLLRAWIYAVMSLLWTWFLWQPR